VSSITSPIAYAGLTDMAVHAVLNLRAARTTPLDPDTWTDLDEISHVLRDVTPERWRLEAALRRLEERGLVWSRPSGWGVETGRQFRSVTCLDG
jgi:hypothetical protein